MCMFSLPRIKIGFTNYHLHLLQILLYLFKTKIKNVFEKTKCSINNLVHTNTVVNSLCWGGNLFFGGCQLLQNPSKFERFWFCSLLPTSFMAEPGIMSVYRMLYIT